MAGPALKLNTFGMIYSLILANKVFIFTTAAFDNQRILIKFTEILI